MGPAKPRKRFAIAAEKNPREVMTMSITVREVEPIQVTIVCCTGKCS